MQDLAQAHALALTYLALTYMDNNEGAHAFNLGNGRGFSVREVIDCARHLRACNSL